LFYATKDGKFLPIAIQLIPTEKTSIFTPFDAEYDWMLAKMFYRATESCVHEVINVTLWKPPSNRFDLQEKFATYSLSFVVIFSKSLN